MTRQLARRSVLSPSAKRICGMVIRQAAVRRRP